MGKPSRSNRLRWSNKIKANSSTTSPNKHIGKLEPIKETIPKDSLSRSTRLIRQSNQIQPTSVISLDGKLGSKFSDQLIDSKGEGIDNESDDGDSGFFNYNQLLKTVMGPQSKKEIAQNIEGCVLQDAGGWSKGLKSN